MYVLIVQYHTRFVLILLRFRKMTIPGLGYMFAHELDLVAFSVDTMGKLDILGHGTIVTRLA